VLILLRVAQSSAAHQYPIHLVRISIPSRRTHYGCEGHGDPPYPVEEVARDPVSPVRTSAGTVLGLRFSEVILVEVVVHAVHFIIKRTI
jgi:hypothetical protein